MPKLSTDIEVPRIRRASRTGLLNEWETMRVDELMLQLTHGQPLRRCAVITQDTLFRFLRHEYDCQNWSEVAWYAPVVRGDSYELSLAVPLGNGLRTSCEQLRFDRNGLIYLVYGDDMKLSYDEKNVRVLVENLVRLLGYVNRQSHTQKLRDLMWYLFSCPPETVARLTSLLH